MDQVLTDPVPSYEQVRKLNYIRMILDESLRLWPTAPQFGLFAKEDTVIGGKYAVKKGETVAVILPKLHRDKEAWGEDAEQFRPERFEDPKKFPTMLINRSGTDSGPVSAGSLPFTKRRSFSG